MNMRKVAEHTQDNSYQPRSVDTLPCRSHTQGLYILLSHTKLWDPHTYILCMDLAAILCVSCTFYHCENNLLVQNIYTNKVTKYTIIHPTLCAESFYNTFVHMVKIQPSLYINIYIQYYTTNTQVDITVENNPVNTNLFQLIISSHCVVSYKLPASFSS